MSPILMRCSDRVVVKDLAEADRHAFIRYQCDPRYIALYDYTADSSRASELFDLFLRWQLDAPRRNFQLGVYDGRSGELHGCAGLRMRDGSDDEAVMGIELAPSDWGRYRFALEVVTALAEFGFENLGLSRIVGDTSSGNTRVAKIASWLGASLVDARPGPDWMTRRGWHEVDWAVTASDWKDRLLNVGRAATKKTADIEGGAQ